jgi:hypothetical protein
MEGNTIIVTTPDMLELVVTKTMRSALESSEFVQHHGKRLLSGSEVAKEYGIAKRTLEHWRNAGTGPEYTTVGGRVVYERARLEKYIAAGRVRPMDRVR